MKMNKDDVIKAIKEKGYWEVNIHPEVYNKDLLEAVKLKEMIQKAIVSLRGWDYPHLFGREDETESGPYSIINGIEKYIYWSEMGTLEFWRMMQSANFLHFFANRFDWDENLRYYKVGLENDHETTRKIIGVIDTLYRFTEIFLFAKRLALQDIFGDRLIITIKIYDIYERKLVVDTPNKWPFSTPRISKVNEPWVWPKTHAVGELIEHFDTYALDAFKNFVFLFQWAPIMENMKDDQRKFLIGKL